jgi:hypothetical protein
MKFPKITPSFMISSLALVIALGGTSYAAVTINGANIKAQSISSAKIKKNALGSGVIKDGKLQAKDFAAGVIPKATRWAYVDRAGNITAQSGGFTVVAAYPTLPNTGTPPADNSLRANGNVYINAGDDLSDNGLTATIVLQNTADQNADGITSGRSTVADANPEFSGEISVSRCNVGAAGSATATGPTNCAPAGAQNATSFVVSPRLSDGGFTTDATRKAFYVVIS